MITTTITISSDSSLSFPPMMLVLFCILLHHTHKAAELQIGGFDRDAIEGEMRFSPIVSTVDYAISITSIKFGKSPDSSVELLRWSNEYQSKSVPGILDSGTSCLVIPDGDMNGRFTDSAYALFHDHYDLENSFFVQIGDHYYEIPSSSWYLSRSKQSCVQRLPGMMDAILIGDVFFRQFLVLYGLFCWHPLTHQLRRDRLE
jgi:hypothetical protein